MRVLNALPGVRVLENKLGLVVAWHRRHDPAAHPFETGLGQGSADLVGIVQIGAAYSGGLDVGRVFCLEVKRDAEAERGSRNEQRAITVADQARWGQEVRKLGGFYCIVHSVAEAVAAVARCRDGASQ